MQQGAAHAKGTRSARPKVVRRRQWRLHRLNRPYGRSAAAAGCATGIACYGNRLSQPYLLPIQADYIGKFVTTTEREIIKVMLPEYDETEQVLLVEQI